MMPEIATISCSFSRQGEFAMEGQPEQTEPKSSVIDRRYFRGWLVIPKAIEVVSSKRLCCLGARFGFSCCLKTHPSLVVTRVWPVCYFCVLLA